MNRKLYVLLCTLSIAISTQAQKTKSEGPDKNVDRYLDNGKAKNCYNLIQFRVAPALSGYVGLSYERKLTRVFSMEGGLYTKIGSKGVVEKYRISDNSGQIENYINKYKGGFGVLLYPKLNIGRRALNDAISVGVRVVKQFSSVEMNLATPLSNEKYTSQIQHTNYMFLVGNHRNLFSNFTFGMDVGFGFSTDIYKNVKTFDQYTNKVNVEDKNYNLTMLFVDMTIGYLL